MRQILKRLAIILLIIAGFWAIFAVGLGVLVHWYGTQDNPQEADVLIVLGAGLRRDGTVGFAMTRRIVHAVELYRAGYSQRILCTGGKPVHRPNSEAYACQQFLIQQGVPAEAIYLEDQSRSTEENALYSQTILQANGWESALVVTDSFHILRAEWIFANVGIEAVFSPVPAERVNSWSAYTTSVVREVFALQWQAVKTLFGINVTYVPFI